MGLRGLEGFCFFGLDLFLGIWGRTFLKGTGICGGAPKITLYIKNNNIEG